MTSEQMLVEARGFLESPTPGTVSVWSRAAPILTRMALEHALHGYWRRRAPGVEHLRNMRAQLNILRMYDRELARDVSYVWHALSRATHHRPYDLDPTRDELSSLIGSTERLVSAMRV